VKKELYEPHFKGKKVTAMGLGLLGRGIGDSAFLAKNGTDLIVTDKKTEEELKSSLEALREFPGIVFRLGEHRLEDFENRDFILKAAGVPLESEYVEHALKQGIPVHMSAALVVSLAKEHLHNVRVIGVTGTRGKSTTTELIAYLLEQNGHRVHRGGNIRGLANLPLLEAVEDGDTIVMELDSWQLQGFDALGISPDIAVFTSFLDDHMNYYKNDRERYFYDKASIYRHQKEGVLIASAQAAEEIRKRDEVSTIVPEIHSLETNLLGEHNAVSLSLAHEVGKRMGIDDAGIREAFKTFKAVEGRLEFLGMFRDAYVFNDNNATTPDAAVAGINAIIKKYERKPLLICGGSDKGLPLQHLEDAIKEKTKACVLLKGTGTDTLDVDKTHLFETLPECVHEAFKLAEKGDVILFSPGFASFSPYFKNEYERNDAFMKIVMQYK
jgi:UDP-N-acetylmuramoylalanine--D-glutamate ligase